MSVRRLLQLGHDPENVVHFVLALLRFEAAGMRMGHVDVHQVGKVKAQVRNAAEISKMMTCRSDSNREFASLGAICRTTFNVYGNTGL